MSENVPSFIKELNDLSCYIRLMGKHVLQVQTRLKRLEQDIAEMDITYRKYFDENKTELTKIHENITNKNEFNRLIDTLLNSVGDTLPPLNQKTQKSSAIVNISKELPMDVPRRTESSEQQNAETSHQERTEETQNQNKKRRFPFLRW